MNKIQEYLKVLEDEEEKKKIKKQQKMLTVDKIKEKYNQRILKFFETEKSSRIAEDCLVKKQNKAQTSQSKRTESEEAKKKKEEIKNKHLENLKNLDLERKMQEELITERLNRTSASPKNTQPSPRFKRRQIFSLTSNDKEIDSKLEEFNKKLLKSSENYNKSLMEKIETVKNQSKKKNSLDIASEYNDKLVNISAKYDHAFHRRKKMRDEFKEKVQEKEAKFLQKSDKVKRLFELESEKILQQNKSLLENDGKVEDFLVEIKKKNRNLSEKRSEKIKALQAGINEKVKMMKKQDIEKKEKILEKHLEIERKKKSAVEKLEMDNKSIRLKAMNFTIEKEKKLALKFLISKTQSPEEVQKLLEKYQSTQTK